MRKLVEHGPTGHIGLGIFGAVLGIIGNQVVARYKMVNGKRIHSATLVADACTRGLTRCPLRERSPGWSQPRPVPGGVTRWRA